MMKISAGHAAGLSAFLGTVLLFAGCISRHEMANMRDYLDSTQNSLSEVRIGGYKYISPLLECEPFAKGRDVELNLSGPLNQYINEKIADKTINKISVYYRDLKTGSWFGINEDDDFTPASLLKVPLMLTYYYESERDPTLLSKRIYYAPEMGDENAIAAIRPSDPIEAGKEYTIEELIKRMIIYSDNNAKNLLFFGIKRKQLEQAYGDLGLPIPDGTQPEDWMSIREYASFFQILYNSTYLHNERSERALELLSQIEFKSGLVAGVPADLVVSHKFGERQQASGVKQLSDCGIIYYPGHPYLLGIITRGTDYEKQAKVIMDISRMVYKRVNRRYHSN